MSEKIIDAAMLIWLFSRTAVLNNIKPMLLNSIRYLSEKKHTLMIEQIDGAI
jgi:hypothetical protein